MGGLLAADGFDKAVDRTGVKKIVLYGQKIEKQGVLMMDVTNASTEDRERICKELGMVNPKLIKYDSISGVVYE